VVGLVTIKVLFTVVGPVTTAELVTVVLLRTSSAAVVRQMEFAVGVAVPVVVLFPTVVVALLLKVLMFSAGRFRGGGSGGPSSSASASSQRISASICLSTSDFLLGFLVVFFF